MIENQNIDLFNTFLHSNEERIKNVAEKFGHYIIDGVPIGYGTARELVIGWLENFKNIKFTNFEIPLVALERFYFVKSTEIHRSLSNLAKKKELLSDPNAHITHMGEIPESSYRLTSNFNSLPNFHQGIENLLDAISPDKKYKILHFDDFLNSGGQVVSIFYALVNKPLPDGEIDDETAHRTRLKDEQIAKLRNCEIHIFCYSAFDEGIERVEKRINNELGLKIKIHRQIPLTKNLNVFGDQNDENCIQNSLPGTITTPCLFQTVKYSDLNPFYNAMKQVGLKLLEVKEPKWDAAKRNDRCLGYGNLCCLTATDHNIPTITFTALWHGGTIVYNGQEITWKNLLPRRKKILGKTDNVPNDPAHSVESQITNEVILHSINNIEFKMMPEIQKTINKFLSLNEINKVNIYRELNIYEDKYNLMDQNEVAKLAFKKISEQGLLERLKEIMKNNSFQRS